MEQIQHLHPAAQVAAIAGIATFACIAVWQAFKTLRRLAN